MGKDTPFIISASLQRDDADILTTHTLRILTDFGSNLRLPESPRLNAKSELPVNHNGEGQIMTSEEKGKVTLKWYVP